MEIISAIVQMLGGLAMFLYGMEIMGDGLKLCSGAALKNFLGKLTQNTITGLLTGTIVTAIIQSCSASIGILQALSVTGVISYEVAVPMVLGMCIGACMPVLLSAIGANVNGKRAAVVYLYFNLAGSILLMVPFYILHAVIGFDFMSATATSMGIAVVNTTYKVLATCLLAPFAKVLEKLAVMTIPEKKSEEDDEEEEEERPTRRFGRKKPVIEEDDEDDFEEDDEDDDKDEKK